MFEKNSWLFFLVVFLTNIIQCITGFAGTVLAMPFSIMLVGFDAAKPILNVLGIVASIGVIASNVRAVNKYELCKILSLSLVGMLAGLMIVYYVNLSAGILYKVLGTVIICFTIMGCSQTFSKYPPKNDKPNVFMYLVLVAGGLVHGMFVCGGPLLVVYAARTLKDKEEFRTTLSAIWLVLNSIIMVSDIQAGLFVYNTNLLMSASTVVLLFALFIGNIIARKMNKKLFMILTYVLMAISGISLLVK
ncbi:MAG: sulfite exporter TauE/SafE family protein [Clostridia bacterium]|nr:sulfite exporter TauE/SafE family protein [Clostridia bacterium]